jgi:peroxiredoxin
MRRTLTWLGIALLFSTFSCNGPVGGKKKITLEGQFDNFPEKKILFTKLDLGANTLIDTIHTDKEGSFNKKIPLESAGIFLLKIDNHNYLTLVAEPGEHISIESKGARLGENYKIEGSPGSLLLRDFDHQLQLNTRKADSLFEAYSIPKQGTVMFRGNEEVYRYYNDILDNQRELARTLIRNNPSSLASAWIINKRFDQNRILNEKDDYDIFQLLDSTLMKIYPNDSWVMDLHERVLKQAEENEKDRKAGERLNPGNVAPNFGLPGPDGQDVTLESLRGNVVLLYFWNSAVPECQIQNRRLKAIYDSHQKEGFRILAVSLDTYKDMWTTAIKGDPAGWTHVSDLQGTFSPVVFLYRVPKELPYYYLIGKDMRIIDRGHDFSSLENKIAPLM